MLALQFLSCLCCPRDHRICCRAQTSAYNATGYTHTHTHTLTRIHTYTLQCNGLHASRAQERSQFTRLVQPLYPVAETSHELTAYKHLLYMRTHSERERDTHTNIHAHTHTHTHKYIHTHVHTCTSTYTHTHTHTHTHIPKHTLSLFHTQTQRQTISIAMQVRAHAYAHTHALYRCTWGTEEQEVRACSCTRQACT